MTKEEKDLYEALNSKNFKKVKELVDKGAVINPDFFISLPKFNQKEIEELFSSLLDLNNERIDLTTAKNKNGNTILHFAASFGNKKAVQFFIDLLGKEKIDITNNYNETPLHHAANNGRTENALELIKAGANREAIKNQHNINYTSESDGDFTPLKVAIFTEHLRTASALITAGANIGPALELLANPKYQNNENKKMCSVNAHRIFDI